jgi:hypothetical protein
MITHATIITIRKSTTVVVTDRFYAQIFLATKVTLG